MAGNKQLKQRMKTPVITYANEMHRDQAVVSLRFAKDFTIINKVITLRPITWNVKAHSQPRFFGGRASPIKGATWSQSRKFWYIAQSDFKWSELSDKLS